MPAFQISERRLREHFEAGLSALQVAKLYEVNKETVYRRARAFGLLWRTYGSRKTKRPVTPRPVLDRALIRRQRASGMTLKAVAALHGVSHVAIWKICREGEDMAAQSIAEQADLVRALMNRCKMADGEIAGEAMLMLVPQDVENLEALAARLDRLAPYEGGIRKLVAGR